MSVMLNYIEGFARMRDKVYKNFLQTSYASLKESLYIIKFATDEKFIVSDSDYDKVLGLGDEIAAMLYKTIESV